ncbi:hypothetical protein [Ectobacillus funiculus]|uniref:Uncharacterized protein n=1 Tax=Ectobacillus funiculus TaxID=137993 RepID=A0ABV5W8N7_9BACI
MKKLFFSLITIGVVGEYLDEAHGIGWYLEAGSKELDRTIGLVIGIPVLIMLLVLLSKILGFGEGKEEEAYQQEEVYQQEVKITWWNDWYED